MKYSICLPYYDPDYQKVEKFSKLLQSIVKCASTDDYELVIVKDGPSYVESHNKAFKNAKGDYLIIFNDDIEVMDNQFLEKFTMDDCISTWKGSAHAWGMSRRTFEKIGYMDEIFKDGFNCEDTDYFHRAVLAGFPIVDVGVELIHDHNNKIYGDRSKNIDLFIKKWGFKP